MILLSPDDTLLFRCDPEDFVRSVVAGHVTQNNPTMDVQYSITNVNEICGHGVKAMLGQAVGGAVITTMFILRREAENVQRPRGKKSGKKQQTRRRLVDNMV